MSRFFHLLRNEIRILLLSPATYVAAVLSLLMMGAFYFLTLLDLSQREQTELPNVVFFRYFLFPACFLAPMLTMKSLAEERRLGTLETLLTTPISAFAVVFSKFLAAYAFYAALWILALAFPLVATLALPQPELPGLLLDPGSLLGGYAFVFLTGMLFIAIGIFASSLTRSQLVAGMLSFSCIFLLIVGLTMLNVQATGLTGLTPTVGDLIGYFQVFDHYNDFVRGLLDTRPLIYYFSGTLLVLGLASLVVEAKS
jgi:ABC-2 type transport system permease protein